MPGGPGHGGGGATGRMSRNTTGKLFVLSLVSQSDSGLDPAGDGGGRNLGSKRDRLKGNQQQFRFAEGSGPGYVLFKRSTNMQFMLAAFAVVNRMGTEIW